MRGRWEWGPGVPGAKRLGPWGRRGLRAETGAQGSELGCGERSEPEGAGVRGSGQGIGSPPAAAVSPRGTVGILYLRGKEGT